MSSKAEIVNQRNLLICSEWGDVHILDNLNILCALVSLLQALGTSVPPQIQFTEEESGSEGLTPCLSSRAWLQGSLRFLEPNSSEGCGRQRREGHSGWKKLGDRCLSGCGRGSGRLPGVDVG